MSNLIQCPKCGRTYGEYRDGYIYQVEGKERKPPKYPRIQRIPGGMTISCENCGHTFDVPSPGGIIIKSGREG